MMRTIHAQSLMLWVLVLSLTACSQEGRRNRKKDRLNRENQSESVNQAIQNPASTKLLGKGTFVFRAYPPFNNKPLKVHYFIPRNAGPDTPILFSFHGRKRNAGDYRNTWILDANRYGFMVFAPEFSKRHFPGGDGYNLGNVFEDGDHPTSETLKPEPVWAFSVIEPLFNYIRKIMDSKVERYDVFGHSAGAQFVHRLLLLKPQARVHRAVAAGAGWYTVPDTTISFPYGIKNCPVEAGALPGLFRKQVFVLAGEKDNESGADGLRTTEAAMKQGNNRLARAKHFFQRSRELAQALGVSFNWRFGTILTAEHDYRLAAREASHLLYNPDNRPAEPGN